MKLSGDYSSDDLVRAFQGNFSCMYVTKNSRGKPLSESEKHIRVEYFFLRADIYKDRIEVYRIEYDNYDKLIKLCEIPIAHSNK